MVSFSCSTTARDDVTLVTAVVRGEGERRRVRLANRLDGPIWPPRRQGFPEDGWDDRGVSVVVPATGRRAVGYASPAPPADPPLELVKSVPADEGKAPDRTPDFEFAALDSAGAVVRELGDPSPPRDAVPLPDGEESDESDNGHGTAGGEGDVTVRDATDASRERATGAPSREARTPDDAPPEPVAAWLDDAEARIDRAESLAAADSLPAATRALRSVGGLDGAAGLAAETERDAAALRAVAERAERLADLADRFAELDADLPCEPGAAATLVEAYAEGRSVGDAGHAAGIPPGTAAKTLHLLGEQVCPVGPRGREIVSDWIEGRLSRDEAETLANVGPREFALAAYVETHHPLPEAREAAEGALVDTDATADREASLGGAVEAPDDLL